MTVRDHLAELVPALRSYAWALTLRYEAADDLVQDTLLIAIGLADTVHPQANLRVWMMRLMRNRFFDGGTAPRTRRAGYAGAVHGPQAGRLVGSEVMGAVAKLPLHDRETLVVVVMLGESCETAAEMFGVPVDAVACRVRRSRAMVAADLRKARAEPSRQDDSHRRGVDRAARWAHANAGARGSRRLT